MGPLHQLEDFRAQLYLWKAQYQPSKMPPRFAKNGPAVLLWKYVFSVFQRLHKSAGAEITVTSLQHLQGKPPVASSGGPKAVQGG